MKKLATVLLILSFVTISVHSQSTRPAAQSKCSLTEATAPAVRGLRLGMSVEQVLALFPNSTKRTEVQDALRKLKSAPPNDEPVYLSFEPATDSRGSQFEGVGSVSTGVLKGRVVDFTVIYDGANWTSIDQWVAKLSGSLKLPEAREWQVGEGESPNKILRCSGIEIEAAIQGGSASIGLRAMGDQMGDEQRMKALEEKKRRDVKP
ncbi:MAG: hypothetical protein WAV20_06360 [Blastocatellia bacterium]